MNGFQNGPPMSTLNDDQVSPEDQKRRKESNNIGGTVDVTHFSDGSSKVHWGGMGGDANYDEYGREC